MVACDKGPAAWAFAFFCMCPVTYRKVFGPALNGERSEKEASPAASLLVWSKRDDGSSTLISVPFNVDGTRGEAPQDAEEWISEDATLGVGIGIFALYVLGLACYLRRSAPFEGRGIPVVTLKKPIIIRYIKFSFYISFPKITTGFRNF